MKSLTSESKPFQRRNSRLSQAGRRAELFSTHSDAELFEVLRSAHEKFSI